MREHSTAVTTGKLMSETARVGMRRAENELVTHMKKMTVVPEVTAFGSVVVLADLRVTVPHELQTLLHRPGVDDARHSSNHSVSTTTILAFLTGHTDKKFPTDMEQSTS